MKKFLLLCFFYGMQASNISPTFIPFVGLAESLKTLIQERKKTVEKIPTPQIHIDVRDF